MSYSNMHIGARNAALIADVVAVHAKSGDLIADVTYAKGNFWKGTDVSIIASDINPAAAAFAAKDPSVKAFVVADFRALPYPDDHVDIVVLDPPYLHGTTQHITDHAYNNNATTHDLRYHEILDLYRAGMKEAQRVSRRQVWVKGKNQIEHGKQRWMMVDLHNIAADLGMYQRDYAMLVAPTIGAGRWSVQKHLRKRESFLWVFDV